MIAAGVFVFHVGAVHAVRRTRRHRFFGPSSGFKSFLYFLSSEDFDLFFIPPFSGQAVPTDPGVHQKLGRRGVFSFLTLNKLMSFISKKTKHPKERPDNSFIPGVAEQFIQPAAEPDLQPSGGRPLRADVQGARPEPVRASGLGAQQLLLQGAQGRNQLGAVQVNPK